jgi:hypothetical protein
MPANKRAGLEGLVFHAQNFSLCANALMPSISLIRQITLGILTPGGVRWQLFSIGTQEAWRASWRLALVVVALAQTCLNAGRALTTGADTAWWL